jgi:hypothetical protein
MKNDLIGINICQKFHLKNYIALKVAIGHTPLQLVYNSYPLLPTKHLLPAWIDSATNSKPTQILCNQLNELKRFQENQL